MRQVRVVVLTPELLAVRLSPGRPAAARIPSCRPAPRRCATSPRSWPIARDCISWWGIRISSVSGAILGRVRMPCRSAAMRPRCWQGGAFLATYCKRELPNYQVFDERRYFASGRDAGQGAVVFGVGGCRFGLLICEDAWFDEPARAAKAAGAQVLRVLNASPFHLGKLAEREQRMAERARDAGCRCCTATRSAGRTSWCSTAHRSRSMRRAHRSARADVRGRAVDGRVIPKAAAPARSHRYLPSRRQA